MVSASETNEKDTARTEAFSDGVFAVAITLLALELKVPPFDSLTASHGLIEALGDEWFTWFAFATSFLTILIVWINHHNVFKVIGRTDQIFLLLNGLLLMSVTLIPFSTELLAEYIERPEQRIVAVVYCGVLLLMAITFNFLWRRVRTGNRLLHYRANDFGVELTSRSFNFGLIMYIIVFALAFIVPIVSLVGVLALAIFFALPVSAYVLGSHPRAEEATRETGDD